MRFPFFSKKERSLGVDFGTSSIKVVQLAFEDNKFVLETYGEIKAEQLPDNSPTPTISLQEEELAEMIKQVISATKAKPENVNLSVPIFSSFVTMLELPVMNSQELQQAVPFQARKYVPVPLEEVVLDWNIAGQVKSANGNEMLNILLVAIPNELVQRHVRIAKMAGMPVASLEMETFALSRAVVNKDDPAVVCLVDIGAHSTDIAITEKGVVQLAHNIDIAGMFLTQNLARSMNVPASRAEILKQSLSNKQFENAANLQEILVPFFDLIVNEVTRTIDEFSSVTGKKVTRLVLSGGASLQNTLVPYFSQKFPFEVVLANPFRDVSFPEALSNTIKIIGPSYAIATGLAMHQFMKSA